jgi:hypothetical protein
MVAENQTSPANKAPEPDAFLLAEYAALRAELLKRIELQHQVISLTLIVFGTMLSFGLQVRSSSIVLLYPVLALFLAASWAHNGRAIRDMVIYIKDQVEAAVGGNNFGWEHRARPHRRLLGRLDFLSARGIFAGTALLATLVAIPLARVDAINIFLFVIAIASTIGSITLLRFFPLQGADSVPSNLRN